MMKAAIADACRMIGMDNYDIKYLSKLSRAEPAYIDKVIMTHKGSYKYRKFQEELLTNMYLSI